MIALTYAPGSEFLWFVNLNASRFFSEAIFLISGYSEFTVVQATVFFTLAGLAALTTTVLGSRGFRFVASHLSLALVSLPLIKVTVAAGSEASAFSALADTALSFSLTELDSMRFPLMAIALFACVALHWEIVKRALHDAAIRRRFHRVLQNR